MALRHLRPLCEVRGAVAIWLRSVRHKAVGTEFEHIGRIQFEYLLRNGVGPGTRFMDAGCGSLRLGRWLIPHLRPGHYCGFDGSAFLLRAGLLQELPARIRLSHGPCVKVVRLGTTPPPKFERIFAGRRFDVIWAHALFDHLPPATIRATLVGLRNVLASSGRILATAFLVPEGVSPDHPIERMVESGRCRIPFRTWGDRDPWHHSQDFFRAAARDARLSLTGIDATYPHPMGLAVLRFEA